MPVDYANGPRKPASCFRIPCSSKIPKSIFSRLKSGLVDLLPHITEARRERKDLSFLSNKELWKTPICCILTKTSRVCGTACQLSPLFLHTLGELELLNRKLFSLHTDHILHGEWRSPPAALEETPALPTSAAGLAGPVGCRLLICTSESVRLHTRDLRDNEGFVLHLRFMDCTKTTQTERKSPLSFFFIDQDFFLNLKQLHFFSGYEKGVCVHELDN